MYDLLKAWKLTENVQATGFETTSVKTSRVNGAWVIIENMIGRPWLWLKLILAKVFTLCCVPSSFPCIPIFKRFKADWKTVARENLGTGAQC